MYTEVLKKLIDDFVSVSGQDIDNFEFEKELIVIEEKINEINKKNNLSYIEEEELKNLKNRKNAWLNSPVYLGNKILNSFENDVNVDEIRSTFDDLYQLSLKSYENLSKEIEKESVSTVWDALEKNIELLNSKKNTKANDYNETSYSNLYEIYKEKLNRIDSEINTLENYINTKKDLLINQKELISKLENIIKENNMFMEKINKEKTNMASNLILDSNYTLIDDEIDSLSEIKEENEKNLDEYEKGYEDLTSEINNYEETLKEKKEEKINLNKTLTLLTDKYGNNGFSSNYNKTLEDLEVIYLENKVKKYENQKYTSYLNLDQMKQLFFNILKNKSKISNNNKETKNENKYIKEEIKEVNKKNEEKIVEEDNNINDSEEIKELMEKYGLTYQEAKAYLEI